MSPDPGDETKYNRALKAQPQSSLVLTPRAPPGKNGLLPKKVEDQWECVIADYYAAIL